MIRDVCGNLTALLSRNVKQKNIMVKHKINSSFFLRDRFVFGENVFKDRSQNHSLPNVSFYQSSARTGIFEPFPGLVQKKSGTRRYMKMHRDNQFRREY